MKKFLATLLFSTGLVPVALAQGSPGFTYGQVPTPDQWNSYFAAKVDVLNGVATNFQDGTLTRTYAGRPLNSPAGNGTAITSNGTAISNSGNIGWFGAATVKSCDSNPFGNQGTWLGCQFGGWWQPADTYSVVEIIGQPGSGIALAAGTRSQDNQASNAYTFYDYCESDGTLGGTVTNRSCENMYGFAWNRQDPTGPSSGSHFAVSYESDTLNNVPLTPQGPYALNGGSFTGNYLAACGGDYSNQAGYTITLCGYALGIASQNVPVGALYDRGIIAAHNAFAYTHGPASDMASVLELGDHQAIIFQYSNSGHGPTGVISSIAAIGANPMQILFDESGLGFYNSAETRVFDFTPTGFMNINGTAGSSRFISAQDAGVTVMQFGITGATSGGNTGDNFFVDAYSDAGSFLFHGMEIVRGIGVAVFPQGSLAGGAITTTSAYGHMWGPTTPGVPTGTPLPPVAAAAYDYNTNTHVLNIYDPVAASWYHTSALTIGGG